MIGSVPLIKFILPTIKMIFFIIAFTVMIVRHSKKD
jgi:hypothetical protein